MICASCCNTRQSIRILCAQSHGCRFGRAPCKSRLGLESSLGELHAEVRRMTSNLTMDAHSVSSRAASSFASPPPGIRLAEDKSQDVRAAKSAETNWAKLELTGGWEGHSGICELARLCNDSGTIAGSAAQAHCEHNAETTRARPWPRQELPSALGARRRTLANAPRLPRRPARTSARLLRLGRAPARAHASRDPIINIWGT